MARCLTLLLLVPGLVVAAAETAPAPEIGYRVHVPAALDALRVEVCVEAGAGRVLRAASSQAVPLYADDGDARVVRRGDRLEIGRRTGEACPSYRVDLGRASQRGHWRRGLVLLDGAILIDPQWFLWLPGGASEVVVEFVLPPGFRLSTPWEPLETGTGTDSAGAVYRVDTRLLRGDTRIALGRFAHYRLDDPTAVIGVAVLPGSPAVDRAMIRRWLAANVAAVRTIHGRFPVDRLQLLVVPVGKGREPVPWGQVSRSGGDAVHVYIDQRQPEDAFMDDWVLSHELSHLLHPALSGTERWITEGLASFYQSIARARTHMITAADAWQDLHAGFERGRRGTRAGRSLASAAGNMRDERAYMQVYWSGAAFFLLADTGLRQATGGRRSLETTLAAFADCCLRPGRVWTAQSFLEQLDRLSGSNIFTRLAATHRRSDRFPDLAAVYARLGLRPLAGDRIGFEDEPAQAERRTALMGAR